MEEIKNACSIVILGGWNTRILTPPWLSNHVYKKGVLEVLFPVDPTLPIIISDPESFSINISNTRLLLNPVNINEEKLKLMAEGAFTILTTLEHTPVSAVGINYGFKENVKQIEFLNYIEQDGSDLQNKFVDLHKLTNINLIRTFKMSDQFDNRIMNFKMLKAYKSSEIIVEFNFHKDVNEAKEAANLVKQNNVIELHNFAINFLTTYYGFTLEA